jgi:hypothetical protein
MNLFQTVPFTRVSDQRCFIASFSSTSAALQRPDHRLYKQIVWDHIYGGKYAVVDPLDPSNILYLSAREYLTAQKTWIANDVAIVVLATPSDKPVTASDTDRTSPPKFVQGFESEGRKATKWRIWSMFSSTMKKHINRFLESKPDCTGCYEWLPQPVVEVNDGNIYDLILDWGLLLHYRLFGLASGRGFRNSLMEFASHIRATLQNQGGLMMSKRMKIYALVVKAYLAGKPYQSTSDLGIRIRLCNGLPKHLPSWARSILRAKHAQHIRFWISLLHAYKGMVVKPPYPDISGIVSNPPELNAPELEQFKKWLPRFKAMFKEVSSEPDFSKSPKLHWAPSSGPNVRPSYQGIWDDLLGWVKVAAQHFGWAEDLRYQRDTKGYLRDILARFEYLVSQADSVELLTARRAIPITKFLEDFVFERDSKYHKLIRYSLWELQAFLKVRGVYVTSLSSPLYSEATKELFIKPLYEPDYEKDHLFRDWVLPDKPGLTPRLFKPVEENLNGPILAKIVLLDEPAGKVRNIVIFDWWSQQFLKPVHDWLFSLLKTLPSDSTFNQEGSLVGFAREIRDEEIFSFDLKAATEMIPQSLYIEVMSEFLRRISARAWMHLLVDRRLH